MEHEAYEKVDLRFLLCHKPIPPNQPYDPGAALI